ncbi:MAG: MFS transporter [Clostridiales bacterium]|nr:MFS transporter [Clostridiales bacterium]
MKKQFRGGFMSKFCLLCCLVYFASYITRINYSAVLVEMITDMNITRELGSIAVTGALITYGLGQITSGMLGDRFPPNLVIAVGQIGTSLINISVFFIPNIYVITVVWCFNGFFQSMLWPPLVRIMAEQLDEHNFLRTCVYVSAASSVAIIAIYLFAPMVIMLSGWRTVFIICGAIGLVTVTLWLAGTAKLKSPETSQFTSDKSNQQKVRFRAIASSGIALIMVAIILQGILRDGITTWMPTFINDVFNLGTSISIVTTVILPIFSIISISIASKLLGRIRHELKTSALLFGTALAAALLMIPAYSLGIVAVSALLMAVITGCMHGINLMLISRLPMSYKRFGKISTISGALNACTYIGAALSTYGFAVLSERFGWYFIIISWVVVCAAGTAVCIAVVPRWTRFIESDPHSRQS